MAILKIIRIMFKTNDDLNNDVTNYSPIDIYYVIIAPQGYNDIK